MENLLTASLKERAFVRYEPNSIKSNFMSAFSVQPIINPMKTTVNNPQVISHVWLILYEYLVKPRRT
jgi:hypothetical protein